MYVYCLYFYFFSFFWGWLACFFGVFVVGGVFFLCGGLKTLFDVVILVFLVGVFFLPPSKIKCIF